MTLLKAKSDLSIRALLVETKYTMRPISTNHIIEEIPEF
jgi:hypothetical protein